jgi:hypothetical protein
MPFTAIAASKNGIFGRAESKSMVASPGGQHLTLHSPVCNSQLRRKQP